MMLAAPVDLTGVLPKSILVHEHVLVDFAGAAIASRSRYSRDDAFAAALPKLEAINNYIHLPDFARTELPAELAKRWIAEWRNGIDGTKPRFIKISVNDAPLGPLDRKLVEAAAITSTETGLTIASHSGHGAAIEQLDLLSALDFPLNKFVWVHAQLEVDHSVHAEVTRAGAWVEFDGISPETLSWHQECVRFMQQEKLLDNVLVSQDSGWWHVEEPDGGQFNGYASIYEDFLPLIPQASWRKLLWDNPRRAFGE